jgi:hypothetical protein|tara:strand:+ start:462 stop:1073 length:612 start_codon:yes stop_codon:yes gene_type:complete
MAKKYKLKEFEIGDVKVDNGTKSTVTDINPTTGAISWSISQIPNIDRLLDESDDLVATAKGVYTKVKDDKVFLDIYKQARSLRNAIRTHTRNNYPEEYKKSRGVNEADVDEMSTSGGAGSYLTPYAFRKKGAKADDEAYTELGYTLAKEGEIGNGADLGPGPKASDEGVKDNAYVKQFKYKLVPKNKKGNYVQKGSGLEVKNF